MQDVSDTALRPSDVQDILASFLSPTDIAKGRLLVH